MLKGESNKALNDFSSINRMILFKPERMISLSVDKSVTPPLKMNITAPYVHATRFKVMFKYSVR